jgi:transposase
LAADAGDVPWDKVLELLVVNRLLAPRSELFVHEKWFPQSAMDVLLDTDARVADKDRLYRCLDRLPAHQPALEQHLAQKWKDLFGATFDLLLYDLTSTCFEDDVDAVPQAQRGDSRDHRPDGQQLVLALVVTPEGFPLTCEIFPGNRRDRTTLEHILDTIETKFGKARRPWAFDRGIVSDDNLALLRQRGAHYLVGTPKSQLKACEQKLPDGDWQNTSEEVQVQLLPEADAVYVLCRSAGRVQKERAMRRRRLRKLIGDLRSLRRRVREGQLQQRELIQRAIGRLTPWQILDQLGRIALVEVWFELRDGRRLCLPRITQPEPAHLDQHFLTCVLTHVGVHGSVTPIFETTGLSTSPAPPLR